MRSLSVLVSLILVLSFTLSGCGTTVTINPTAVAVAPTAVSVASTALATVTVPPELATAASGIATEAPQAATALANVTVPPVTVQPITPLPPEVAAAVITTFAKSQLGIDVTVIRAFGGVGELQLPETAQGGVREALKLAGTSYGAALQNGLAVVALGRGEGQGTYDAQIKWASLGAYVMRSTDPYPADEAAALAMVKKMYPRLGDLNFTPRATPKGFAFYLSTTTSAVDPSTGATQTVGKVIICGVNQADIGGLVLVYAVIGNGALAQPLAAQP